MLACVDVGYTSRGATAACLLFHHFGDAAEARALTAQIADVAPYEPGAFYRRELPCLLEVLHRVEDPLEVVIIDGYVWLSADRRPGLGARLHEALGGVVVVGVAKTGFHGAGAVAVPVLRGKSAAPLHVTAAGAPATEAAGWIRSMHGPHRIPTLLRRVDRLSRATPAG